jgi:TPP-dependent pyruvate/acetoin dehydrogenase alpha subunit
VLSTLRDPRRDSANDPVRRARKTLLSDRVRLQELEDQIEQEISHVLASALAEVPS